MEFTAFSIFATAALVFAIVIVFAGVKTVPQGYEYTVERFGRYTRTLRPGLHLITPVVEPGGARDIEAAQQLGRRHHRVAVAQPPVMHRIAARLDDLVRHAVDEEIRMRRRRIGIAGCAGERFAM